MSPFDQSLRYWTSKAASGCAEEPALAQFVTRFARALCAISQACVDQAQYARLFAWLFPDKFEALLQHCRACSADSGGAEACTAMLKLAAEATHSRGHRVRFDSDSANGIILFRQAAAVVQVAPLLRLRPHHHIFGGGEWDGDGSVSSTVLQTRCRK